MRTRTIVLTLGAVIALMIVAAPVLLAPGGHRATPAAAAAIAPSEHAQTIGAMRPPKRQRPVIALLALNRATEVTDLLVPYGVLRRADVADVTVVAEHDAPVRLHPISRLGLGPELLEIDPQSTMRAFDARHPDGADYVIVPAMEPRNDPAVLQWILAQHRKGAKIVSVCNGALTLAAAGLLDGRRATAHWSAIRDLQEAHPSMQWVQNRRYVADKDVVTSTGISASMPAMVALVEAIAGRPKAEQLARELGLSNWDARHVSDAFQLTTEHQKTYLRNWLSFWRHETLGLSAAAGVDEVALGLTADAYSRTALSTVAVIPSGGDAVRSKHGLVIRAASPKAADEIDLMLPPPSADAPARTMERELAQIVSRFDRPTADIVALVMEYPWSGKAATTPR